MATPAPPQRRKLSGEDAQNAIHEIPPEHVIPKPELRQVEAEQGLPGVEPARLEEFRGQMMRVVPLEEEGLGRLERGDSTGLRSLEEAHAQLEIISLEQSVGKASTDLRAPKAAEVEVVTPSGRSEQSHGVVTGEVVGVKASGRSAEQEDLDVELAGRRDGLSSAGSGGVKSNVVKDVTRLMHQLSTEKDPERRQVHAEDLRQVLDENSTTLDELGVKIPFGADGSQVVEPDVGGEALKEGGEGGRDAEQKSPRIVKLDERGRVAASGGTLATRRAERDSLAEDMQSGKKVERQFASAEHEVKREDYIHSKLEAEFRGVLNRVRSRMGEFTSDKGFKADLEEIAKHADVELNPETSKNAIETAAVLADVEKVELKAEGGGMNPMLLADVSQTLKIQKDLSAEGLEVSHLEVVKATVDVVADGKNRAEYPSEVLSSPTYVEDVKGRVRRSHEDGENIFLKEYLASGAGKKDALSGTASILDGLDDSEARRVA